MAGTGVTARKSRPCFKEWVQNGLKRKSVIPILLFHVNDERSAELAKSVSVNSGSRGGVHSRKLDDSGGAADHLLAASYVAASAAVAAPAAAVAACSRGPEGLLCPDLCPCLEDGWIQGDEAEKRRFLWVSAVTERKRRSQILNTPKTDKKDS